jgi:hypothetical protein
MIGENGRFYLTLALSRREKELGSQKILK